MKHNLSQTIQTRRRIRLAVALFVTVLLTGCNGSGGSTNNGGGTNTGTDMGTLTMPSTTYQYQLKNAASSMVLGISGQSQTAGTSVVQEANTNSTDSMWHFMPNVYSSDIVNIENMLTHQVLGFSATAPTSSGGPSTSSASSSGAQALQYSDTGTDDQNWQLYLLTDGNYLIKNHYSGLYLEDENSSTSSSATISQGARSSGSTGCTCQEWTLTQSTAASYSAPLTVSGSGIYVHDPDMIQDAAHVYWLYGTHNTLAKSTDLAIFTSVSPDFSTSAEPSWWTTIYAPASGSPDMWAPSVLHANSTYYQYYAVPVEPDSLGGEAVIALATSSSPSGNPAGTWTDKGVMISSWSNSSTPTISGFGFKNTTTYNAIDPAPFVDANGDWWLVFGSWFDGTHLIQLDPTTGLQLSSNTTMTSVAYRYWGEEGPFIYPYVVNGTQYYYYFAPINACCSSTSPYRIIYGRATSPGGPYLDRGGVDLKENGGTVLLSTHGNIVGPGGQSVFTDTGSDGSKTLPTLVYHYYDSNNNGTPTLGLSRIAFTSDGWPYVE
ncbi:MAG: family 43 glycosylhydrolase [Terracidiphilus sp.]|jgi:arabinan endo-1,5-alpha-L-arabinosidase